MARGSHKEATVLVVDDTLKNIQVLGALLRAEGLQVSVAQDGPQALGLAEKLLPDLILLDVMMPGMDGFEVCKRLKANPETAEIPIIFLTAKVESDDIVNGLNLGAVDYILKPFNSTELLVRVRNHLALALAKKKLAEQNEERLELLHILCHDLANSFGSILSFLSVEDQDLMENWSTFKPLMISSAENASGLIELIRQMRALDEGKLTVQTEPKNLAQLIDKSLSLLQHKLKAKGIQVETQIDGAMSVMVEEVSFVNTVVNNLITNAVKFSHPDSVIKIKGTKREGRIQLSIADQGVGMSERFLGQIFDLTKSTSKPGTSGETGTGFGLPLVKKFVSRYGGKIEIQSQQEEPSGTKIKLLLQAAP